VGITACLVERLILHCDVINGDAVRLVGGNEFRKVLGNWLGSSGGGGGSGRAGGGGGGESSPVLNPPPPRASFVFIHAGGDQGSAITLISDWHPWLREW